MGKTHFLHAQIDRKLWEALNREKARSGENSAQIIEAALRHHLGLDGDMAFQTSTIGAVLDGVNHGDISVGELREHGDFGIGTFDGLDGEMVMLDGTVYRIDPDCRAHEVSDDVRSPFATVTRWVSRHATELSGPMTPGQFELQALELMCSKNYLFGIRCKARFRSVEVRSVVKQQAGVKLLEATQSQSTLTLKDCEGTLVGFYTPSFLNHIGVEGFHLHFITRALDYGGHVLNFDLLEGRLELDEMPQLDLALPSSLEFRRANLAVDKEELNSAEKNE